MTRTCILSLLGVAACAASAPPPVADPPPVAQVHPTASRPVEPPSSGQLRAADVAIGSWHLGQPVGALATARPDLWKQRGFDAGGGDLVAMTEGRRRPEADDPLKGSYLLFVGSAFGKRPAEEAFVPTMVIALGDKALEPFQPALAPLSSARASFGPVDFAVDTAMGEDEERATLERALNDASVDASQKQRMTAELARRPPWPKTLRVERHASGISVVSVDERPIGAILGDVPRQVADPFYGRLRKLTLTHLALR